MLHPSPGCDHLVACIPSAGERFSRFLALLEELYYSGHATKPNRLIKHPARGCRWECERRDDDK